MGTVSSKMETTRKKNPKVTLAIKSITSKTKNASHGSQKSMQWKRELEKLSMSP